eukprot:scaffold2382_cov108-Isochrysis_galbana.AAC.2
MAAAPASLSRRRPHPSGRPAPHASTRPARAPAAVRTVAAARRSATCSAQPVRWPWLLRRLRARAPSPCARAPARLSPAPAPASRAGARRAGGCGPRCAASPDVRLGGAITTAGATAPGHTATPSAESRAARPLPAPLPARTGGVEGAGCADGIF